MDKYYVVAIVLIVMLEADSARILAVFPTPSISHQVVFRPLTQELVKRGHEVVVITTDPAYSPGQAPVNLTEIDVGNVSYYSWQNAILNADVGKRNDILKQLRITATALKTIFEKQLQTKPFGDIIKNSNNVTFDLILLEMCVRPAMALSHIYKSPIILLNSNAPFFGIYEKLGMPSNPLMYPVVPRQRLYNLTFWETVKEVINYYYMGYIYNSLEYEENEMLQKYFGPDLPPVSKFYNNVDMFFQNIYLLFMDSPPVPPNLIYLGGLHQIPTKELSQDLNLYLNNSKNGVIYVSFGTNVKTSLLPPQKLQIMINVFSNLPYDVLWKMDTKDLAGIWNNIKVSEWVPQANLLKHPKVKAFVMQGGQQSTDEAIAAGVPLIGIPTFADQWYNVEKYLKNKIGVHVDWYSITEENLRNAILTVTEDISYRENIKRFKSIINDQPQSPLERAMLWIEHVLRHGGAKHLRAPASNMSWTEYYELDIVLIIITSLSFALYLTLLIFYSLWLRALKIFKRVKGKNS